MSVKIENRMLKWIKELFPIMRSITGQGVRDTLNYLKKINKELIIKSIPTGTKCFDWKVPEEWNIKSAYIEDEFGKKILDIKKNNLHVVNYSSSINKIISYNELQKHLYSIPKQPNAIPYITSYYKKIWGFCISEKQRKKLKKCKYKVFIDSSFTKGNLNYGEIYIKGQSKKEILISTNICHPSMANNELSGPAVSMALSLWLKNKKNKYSFRIIFVPETIGSICYIKKNFSKLKKVIAGFNIVCVGDNKNFSFLPSKNGDTLSDRAALLALKENNLKYDKYSFLDRGSDERQYCSPGIELPICSVMRSKYGTYPEYHTSLDNLNFISSKGLLGSFEIYKYIINIIELNQIYKTKILCEPFLTKYKLYPTLSTKETKSSIKTITNFLMYVDGKNDLIELSNILNENFNHLKQIEKKLLKNKLISIK